MTNLFFSGYLLLHRLCWEKIIYFAYLHRAICPQSLPALRLLVRYLLHLAPAVANETLEPVNPKQQTTTIRLFLPLSMAVA